MRRTAVGILLLRFWRLRDQLSHRKFHPLNLSSDRRWQTEEIIIRKVSAKFNSTYVKVLQGFFQTNLLRGKVFDALVDVLVPGMARQGRPDGINRRFPDPTR